MFVTIHPIKLSIRKTTLFLQNLIFKCFQERVRRQELRPLPSDWCQHGGGADALLQGGGGRGQGRLARYGGLRHAQPEDTQRDACCSFHGKLTYCFLW